MRKGDIGSLSYETTMTQSAPPLLIIQHEIHPLFFVLYGELSFLTFRFPGSARIKHKFCKEEIKIKR